MINLEGKTRTYWYLFLPFRVTVLDKATNTALKRLDITNCYLGDPKKKHNDSHLYVECKTNYVAFSSNIDIIRRCSYYVEHYSIAKDKCLIVFRYGQKTKLELFKQGRYSEMYSSTMYTLDCFKELYIKEKTEKRTIHNPALYVLAHSEKYFNNEILPLLTNASDEAIKTIKANEYDQPPEHHRQLLPVEQGSQ